MKTSAVVTALALVSLPLAARADCQVSELLDLPVTMQGLRPVVTAKINGAEARLVLDSGEYESWLTSASAARLGVKATLAMSNYLLQSAGGSPMATVKAFSLGGVAFKDVAFGIDEDKAGQDIDGFIGQKLLKVADVDYDLPHAAVRLMRSQNCGAQPLAYWLKPGETFGVVSVTSGGPEGTDATATATVNGVPLTVGFSTGDTVSLLTLSAARRAGIDPHDAGVVTAGSIAWGGDSVQMWIAPVKSFEFGGEEVRNTTLRVTSTDVTGYDLVLGADFFLSHHLYFANSQHKLYITYAGGPVFAAYNSGRTESYRPKAAKPTSERHTPPPVM